MWIPGPRYRGDDLQDCRHIRLANSLAFDIELLLTADLLS